jgi:hypothetical protein
MLKLDINRGKKQNDEKKKDVQRNLRIDTEKLRNTRDSYQNSVKNFIDNLDLDLNEPLPQDLLPTFENFIVEAAKECAEIEIIARSDWFASNETELLHQIHLRNKAQETFDCTESIEAKNDLKAKRKLLHNTIRKAKRNWMKEYAQKCSRLNFNHAPKKTWDIVFEIIKGFQGHYKKSTPKQFKDAKGRTKTGEADNADVIKEYYHNVFNQKVNVDMNEINKLHQKDINEHLGRLPSQTDVTSAIKSMHNEKAPGKSGVTTNMLKTLPPEGFKLLTNLIQNYWQNIDCDFEAWHTNILSLLYKGKGASRDPKNWRPICLKEK